MALIACIIGIVVCLVFNQPYLSIAFAVGGLGACYSTYLSSQYRGMRSNIKQLESNIQNFQAELQKFESENQELANHVSILGTYIEKVESANTEFANNNEDLRSVNHDLEKNVDRLRREIDRLKVENENQLLKLDSVADKMKKMTEVAGTNNVEFAELLAEFQQMTEQREGLKNEFAKFLEALQLIAGALSDDHMDERIALVSKLETQVIVLRAVVADLDVQKDQFIEVHKNLSEEIDRLRTASAKLEKIVEQFLWVKPFIEEYGLVA